MNKNILQIYCFIPKCDYIIKPYRISLNYIIQSYYRFKNRKNHETLDFEKNENANQIFLSFLSLFKNMEFKNLRDLNIYLYGLTFTDEKKIEKYDEDFFDEFSEIMIKISKNPFKFESIDYYDQNIVEILTRMEEIYPQNSFKDVRNIIVEEINECKIIYD